MDTDLVTKRLQIFLYDPSYLAVILRIYNSDKIINEESFEIICKDTYQLILAHYPWANVTPTLHKILAHSVD